MWALDSYDAVGDAPDEDRGGPDPSAYDLIVARRRDEAALKQQLRKHGDAEMRGGAAEAPGGIACDTASRPCPVPCFCTCAASARSSMS